MFCATSASIGKFLRSIHSSWGDGRRKGVPKGQLGRSVGRSDDPSGLPLLKWTQGENSLFAMAQQGVAGGERGIRTPGRGVSPYNGLANRRLQPLGHLSGVHWTDYIRSRAPDFLATILPAAKKSKLETRRVPQPAPPVPASRGACRGVSLLRPGILLVKAN
jgi:hypothetical protein